MTLIELDSEMHFLKLSNDPKNGTQNDSEGLKIVRKFKNSPNQLLIIPQPLITRYNRLLASLVFCSLHSH